MQEGITGQEPIRSPAQQSMEYFRGGANAGDVLVRKSPIVEFESEGIAQYSYEFLSDLNDVGDMGFIRNIAVEHGFTVSAPKTPGEVRLGNMPHHLTYTNTSDGFFVSTKSGVLYHQDDADKRDWVQVTADNELAEQMFRDLYEVPEQAKGRELFARYMKYWESNADKILIDKPRK